MLKRTIAAILVLVFALPAVAGIGSKNAAYVGGTVTGIKQGTEAQLDLSSAEALAFRSKKAEYFTVPYSKITALSYGQHAGRRVGATVALGVTTLGIGALPVLFSKKRRHYLTIEYVDSQGANQAAILELGKDVIRTDLTILEVRSGKKVEYEDEEARKAGNK